MKQQTVILLASGSVHWIKFYHFSEIQNLSSCRLVAITNKNDINRFPNHQKNYFDQIYQVDYEHDDKFLKPLSLNTCLKIVSDEIKHHSKSNTYIISVDEDNVELSGKIRDQLELSGNSFSLLHPFRDKVLMKKILASKGIRVPYFLDFNKKSFQKNAVNYYYELAKKLNTPFILKPKDSAGSFGVEKIGSMDTFLTFTNDSHFIPEDYEAEEFIDGKLYHANSVAKDGELIFSETSTYSYPLLELLEGKTVISTPILKPNKTRDQLIKFTETVLKSLGMPDGTSHMEMFITKKDEIIFLEVGARNPGAFVIRNYLNAFNVNIPDLDFSVQSNLPFKLNPRLEKFSFWALLPRASGTVKHLIEPTLNNSYEIIWNIKEGEKLDLPKSIADYAALLFVESTDYESLVADIKTIQEFAPIEITAIGPNSELI